jgi:ubiquinone biosynthesis protein Coq4
MDASSFTTDEFEGSARHALDPTDIEALARAVRDGEPSAPFRIAAQCVHVATIAPERLVATYDALCRGWLGDVPHADAIGGPAPSGEIARPVWDAIWDLALDPAVGTSAADITVRTAAIAGLLPEVLHQRVAAMALSYPGIAEAAAAGMPRRFTLEELAECPTDSLGGRLHSLVVDKGFDLEVLDRDAYGAAGLPAPLDYLNVRILQCHDAWHEVAGYETTGLHEVAISGFQMGQFGHHYSSVFLAVVLTKVAFTEPFEGFGFLLDIILSAYRHGRETPPLMGVEWEAIWDRPLDEIRTIVGITPYASPYPAGILETLRSS